LTHTKYVLLRWPDITANSTATDEVALNSAAKGWVDELARRNFASQFKTLHWGVVRFRVGDEPVVIWADADDDREASDSELLQRALKIELSTLLEFGHAIWRPVNYHYVLPSGQHAAAFIRVGDAFRSPRDVRVVTSWLTPRMRDKQAIVADSATLVPLITDLHAVAATRGWRAGRVEMLDEYPRTKLDISRVIMPMRQESGGVLALMSVNSSGRYRGMFLDGLDAAFVGEPADWSMVVIVDKTQADGDELFPMNGVSIPDAVTTWSGFAESDASGVPEARCPWCKKSGMAQVVRIDPRTFEALVMPDVDRQMPSVVSAKASTTFWELCDGTGALGHTAFPVQSPSSISRPKAKAMSLLVDNVALLESTSLAAEVAKRIDQIHEELKRSGSEHTVDYTGYDAVLVSKYEAELPLFDARLAELLPLYGLADAEVVAIDLQPDGVFPVEQLREYDRVVIFALGSVSGWNLRQLLLGLQDAWRRMPSKKVAGIVIHARPPTKREWENLRNSFSNRLDAMWTTFLPWRNPMEEERAALELLPTELLDSQSEQVRNFVTERQNVTGPRANVWRERMAEFAEVGGHTTASPDPRSVLWGLPPYGTNERLRNQSLYGFEVGALTALAAVGAAMHATRQGRVDYDPRWLVFDMPAITRSYYDAIILASILRWAEPQETWWGASEGEAEAVMTELLARTVQEGDRQILIPELLYAASQGKVPGKACEALAATASEAIKHWDKVQRAPAELGLAMLNNSQFTAL
jgi:hypothetical protein